MLQLINCLIRTNAMLLEQLRSPAPPRVLNKTPEYHVRIRTDRRADIILSRAMHSITW